MQQNASDYLEEIAGKVATYYNSPGAAYNGATRLNWVRLNVVDKATGKYVYPNDPLLYEFPAPISNGFGIGIPQIAYCVTLKGLQKRGPGSRGRWYVPMSGSGNLSPGGKLGDAVCLAFAGAAQTFLQDIRDSGELGGPQVFIPWLYGQSKTGVGTDSSLQEVLVGNVLDTQRRRREQLVESYFGEGGYQS